MDLQLVNRVLEIARFYPSGDNSQPFRFRLVGSELHIDYYEPAARHTLIYDDMLILLTLGGLLHYVKTGFAQQNKAINLSLQLDGFSALESSNSIVVVTLAQSGDIPTERHDLRGRVTDRRPYQPFHTIDINTDTVNSQSKHLRCDAWINAPEQLLHFFAMCDSLVWESKNLALDIIKSVSFANESPKRGLPWRNLGVSYGETIPIRLVQKYPSLYSLFAPLVKVGMNQSQRKLWGSSSSFLLFSFDKDLSNHSIVDAYQDMMKFLTELNQQGYHYQPSTMSTEVLNIPLKSPNLTDSAGLNVEPFLNDISSLRQELRLEGRLVGWIVRIGKPVADFPREARTNRLDVSEILK
ncbi:hypothetical protein GCM10009092_37630 [Bowmanella denitrificans]|uniref:Nitroreductase domain-containing protein n=1 Tax=Bowmanella denitrificans TaxID=366582 RepID=A0ABN0XQ84_9ALTE